MSSNDPDFSSAIADFLERERLEAEKRAREASQNKVKEEVVQDPPQSHHHETVPVTRPAPTPKPTPRHEQHEQHDTPRPESTPPQPENVHHQQESTQQIPPQITFIYENDEMHLHPNDATPTAIAEYFGINRNEIQLKRNDKVFYAHTTEDRFKPNLKVGNKYIISRIRQQPTPPPRHHSEQNNSGECTLISNSEKKKVPSGFIKRAKIIQTFKLGPQMNDILLIEEDGTVIKSQQFQYPLKPDAIYHVVFKGQEKLDNDDEHDDPNEIFLKPMSLLPPFMVAVVRSLYALSFTGDAVTFTPKSEQPKNTQSSKMLCSNTLSTCAYQITYRFNAALKALQTIVRMIDERDPPNDRSFGLFGDSKQCAYFCGKLSNGIKLLEKAHFELEELLNIVLAEIRTTNPSIESVKISLKIEENQECRIHEKDEQKKNNDRDQLTEKCETDKKIANEIHPIFEDVDKVSCNRKILNTLTKRVENILNNNKVPLEDVANLLEFCAKISHCNLMQWIFTWNLFQHLGKDFDAASQNSVECRKKIEVAKAMMEALLLWEDVSRAVSLPVNMNESVENIHDRWNELKDAITTSQYSLEIGYFSQE